MEAFLWHTEAGSQPRSWCQRQTRVLPGGQAFIPQHQAEARGWEQEQPSMGGQCHGAPRVPRLPGSRGARLADRREAAALVLFQS